MTPLRQRMIEDLNLRGYAERTVEAYVQAVSRLARFYNLSPDCLSEEQVRQYFLHLTERKVARGTHTIALCGIKFFYEQTLGRTWTLFGVARPKTRKKLPVVLSRDEVWTILGNLRNPTYRACLVTIYTCGLRLLEGARLQVPQVDGSRKMLYIQGKGGKDRYVPLPDDTLELLRQLWRTHRHPLWVFPAPTHSRKQAPSEDPAATPPLSRNGVQHAFRRALQKSGIRKRAHVHTLRHCYATHLLEDGVCLPLIQEYLGHSSLRTTRIYLHLTREIRDAARDPINGLMRRL